MRDALSALLFGKLEEAEADVAFNGKPGKYATFLKDKNPARIRTANSFTINQHLAMRGREKSRDHVQQRRFAAA